MTFRLELFDHLKSLSPEALDLNRWLTFARGERLVQRSRLTDDITALVMEFERKLSRRTKPMLKAYKRFFEELNELPPVVEAEVFYQLGRRGITPETASSVIEAIEKALSNIRELETPAPPKVKSKPGGRPRSEKGEMILAAWDRLKKQEKFKRWREDELMREAARTISAALDLFAWATKGKGYHKKTEEAVYQAIRNHEQTRRSPYW